MLYLGTNAFQQSQETPWSISTLITDINIVLVESQLDLALNWCFRKFIATKNAIILFTYLTT
jgi:hypothetical protein